MYHLATMHFVTDRHTDSQDKQQHHANSQSYCVH